ncbi:MAG: tyrosine-type recombinase/integrase [Opitutaceae bacterium]|nr:tyrosine-type recombinase/integrase [Opitutaceae bacterium]
MPDLAPLRRVAADWRKSTTPPANDPATYSRGYLILIYTGQRCQEIASLVWGDVHLEAARPYVLIREHTTKDKAQRAIPLHPALAVEIAAIRATDAKPDALVFDRFPTWTAFEFARKRAGIAKKDATGRVVHLHALRKTWQTLGVQAGVNQRAAQEILGHSDANLTAKIYTDVPALQLEGEIAKLPWFEVEKGTSGMDKQNPGKEEKSSTLEGLLCDLIQHLQSPDIQEEISTLTASALLKKNGGRTWIRTGCTRFACVGGATPCETGKPLWQPGG